jgi:hypothetical protein
MATPRKPGARRGRPPKPKPIAMKRKPGRPAVPLRRHPHRYLIAEFDVMTRLVGTKRGAALFLVLHWSGATIVNDGSVCSCKEPEPVMAAARRRALAHARDPLHVRR